MSTPDPLQSGRRYDTYIIGSRMISINSEAILDVDLESGAIRTFTPEELALALDMVYGQQAPAEPRRPRSPSSKVARVTKG